MSEGIWFDGRNPFSPDNNADYYWGAPTETLTTLQLE